MQPIILQYLIPLIFIFSLSLNTSAQTTIGHFTHQVNIGNPKLKGSATFDESQNTYTLKAAGKNIWFRKDEFFFLYNQLEGDFILTADFELQGTADDPLRKVGWMIRPTLNAQACHISTFVHGDGLTLLQWRPRNKAKMKSPQHELYAPASHYQTLQLERKGNKMIMRAAQKDSPLKVIGSHEMKRLPDQVFAGIAICSHDPDALETAKVWKVKIEKPANQNP